MERAFAVANDILRRGVIGISKIIVRPGIINMDFADAGSALMGIGSGTDKDRAVLTVSHAISSPLPDAPIERATRIMFNMIGGVA